MGVNHAGDGRQVNLLAHEVGEEQFAVGIVVVGLVILGGNAVSGGNRVGGHIALGDVDVGAVQAGIGLVGGVLHRRIVGLEEFTALLDQLDDRVDGRRFGGRSGR